MSHMYDEDPPIKTGVASQAYRDNFDRIFRQDKTEEFAGAVSEEVVKRVYEPINGCPACCFTGAVLDPDIDPPMVETEGDLLKNCPFCTST